MVRARRKPGVGLSAVIIVVFDECRSLGGLDAEVLSYLFHRLLANPFFGGECVHFLAFLSRVGLVYPLSRVQVLVLSGLGRATSKRRRRALGFVPWFARAGIRV